MTQKWVPRGSRETRLRLRVNLPKQIRKLKALRPFQYLPRSSQNIMQSTSHGNYISSLNDLGSDFHLSETCRHFGFSSEMIESPTAQARLFPNHQKKICELFTLQKAYYVCVCSEEIDYQLETPEWRLCIGSLETSLKAVLLRNDNTYPSVLIAYSTNKKRSDEYMENLVAEELLDCASWPIGYFAINEFAWYVSGTRQAIISKCKTLCALCTYYLLSDSSAHTLR